jgi:hypothetical protein
MEALFSLALPPKLSESSGKLVTQPPSCSDTGEFTRLNGRREISSLRRAPALEWSFEKGNSLSPNTTSLDI